MNQWDVVAAVELLPILGKDKKLNDRIFSLIEKSEVKKGKVTKESDIKELLGFKMRPKSFIESRAT